MVWTPRQVSVRSNTSAIARAFVHWLFPDVRALERARLQGSLQGFSHWEAGSHDRSELTALAPTGLGQNSDADKGEERPT